MTNKFILIILVSFVLFSCKNDDTLTSFALNNEKIEDSNENLNIKNGSFLEIIYIQAEKDDELISRKETAKKVHAIGMDLFNYLEDLKNAIKRKNSTKFVNELFFNGNDITKEGEEFLMYIKNYRESMFTILNTANPRITGMVKNNFDLLEIEDRRGQKTKWLHLHFKDFPPIISITKLSTMQSDIRRIETQYLAELLGVKLNTNTKKIINDLKAKNDTQIGDNLKSLTEEEQKTIVDENETKAKENVLPVNDNITVTNDKDLAQEQDNIEESGIIKSTPEKLAPKKLAPKKIEPVIKTHTVIPGDNLYRISLKYKTTADNIKKLNNMKDNNIALGQVLKLE